VADQQYTLNAEGEPTEAIMNVPLGAGMIKYNYDMAGRLTDANYGGENHLTYNYDVTNNLLSRSGSTPLAPAQIEDSYTYDAACQISSAGYEYDARSRQTAAPGKTFAYDGASRLTSVTADGSTATLTYNGLGDLRTRTVGGTTTHHYHNYALGLDPIVAEKAGTAYKRFYVYTPGGSLLYSIDPATGQVRFYHFDRVGSTIFLTDGAGAVSDAYAYDPYGELLGHTGASDQPFTFVGRYGVRYERVGGLHDMRARAYDPATARFLTRDPIWPVLRDLQSLNPYQYAAQNPVRYVDPGGESIGTIVGKWVIGKIIGFPLSFIGQIFDARRSAGGPGDTLPPVTPAMREVYRKQHQRIEAMKAFDVVLIQEAIKQYIIQRSVGGNNLIESLTPSQVKKFTGELIGYEGVSYFRSSKERIIFGILEGENLQKTRVFIWSPDRRVDRGWKISSSYKWYYMGRIKNLLPGIKDADDLRYAPFKPINYRQRIKSTITPSAREAPGKFLPIIKITDIEVLG